MHAELKNHFQGDSGGLLRVEIEEKKTFYHRNCFVWRHLRIAKSTNVTYHLRRILNVCKT